MELNIDPQNWGEGKSNEPVQVPPKCSICGVPLKPWHPGSSGYGNNAEPVNSGRCCDECNWKVVVPLRIKHMQEGRKDW